MSLFDITYYGVKLFEVLSFEVGKGVYSLYRQYTWYKEVVYRSENPS